MGFIYRWHSVQLHYLICFVYSSIFVCLLFASLPVLFPRRDGYVKDGLAVMDSISVYAVVAFRRILRLAGWLDGEGELMFSDVSRWVSRFDQAKGS